MALRQVYLGQAEDLQWDLVYDNTSEIVYRLNGTHPLASLLEMKIVRRCGVKNALDARGIYLGQSSNDWNAEFKGHSGTAYDIYYADQHPLHISTNPISSTSWPRINYIRSTMTYYNGQGVWDDPSGANGSPWVGKQMFLRFRDNSGFNLPPDNWYIALTVTAFKCTNIGGVNYGSGTNIDSYCYRTVYPNGTPTNPEWYEQMFVFPQDQYSAMYNTSGQNYMFRFGNGNAEWDYKYRGVSGVTTVNAIAEREEQSLNKGLGTAYFNSYPYGYYGQTHTLEINKTNALRNLDFDQTSDGVIYGLTYGGADWTYIGEVRGDKDLTGSTNHSHIGFYGGGLTAFIAETKIFGNLPDISTSTLIAKGRPEMDLPPTATVIPNQNVQGIESNWSELNTNSLEQMFVLDARSFFNDPNAGEDSSNFTYGFSFSPTSQTPVGTLFGQGSGTTSWQIFITRTGMHNNLGKTVTINITGTDDVGNSVTSNYFDVSISDPRDSGIQVWDSQNRLVMDTKSHTWGQVDFFNIVTDEVVNKSYSYIGNIELKTIQIMIDPPHLSKETHIPTVTTDTNSLSASGANVQTLCLVIAQTT